MAHKQLWLRGTTIHVKVSGLENEPAYRDMGFEQYIMDSLEDLNLDLGFAWDNDTSEGGISIIFHRDMDQDPFLTRIDKQFINVREQGPYQIVQEVQYAKCFIDLRRMDLYPSGSNRRYAFRNILLHEFLHALGVDHILPYKNKKGKFVIKCLMNRHISTHQNTLAFPDKQALQSLYGGIGKRFTFKHSDIGKTAYLINRMDKSKSISTEITGIQMVFPGLKGLYKVIVEN